MQQLANCFVPLETQYFPNIERIGDGYDVYKGNPYQNGGKGLDPGYKLTPVFMVTYHNGRKTPDEKYFLPDNVDAAPDSSCSMDAKAKTIRDVSEYRVVLDDSVTFGVSSPGARFSASADYTTIHDVTSTHESQLYSTSAVCTTYSATIETLPSRTQLSEDFLAHVQQLPIDDSVPEDTFKSYQEFIAKFGTHFVLAVTMGGKYGKRYTISTDSVVNLVSQGYKMREVAAATFENEISVGVQHETSVTTSHIHTFQEQYKETTIYNVGGCPQSGIRFNISTWYDSVERNPQPVKYELRSLSSLLTSDRFPDDVDISKKSSLLDDAVLGYCTGLGLQYCQSQPPDPPKQIKIVQYSTYKSAIGDTSFFIPKLNSTHHKIIGTLLSCYFDWITKPTIVIDSSSAPTEVIQSAIGWTMTFANVGAHTAFFRPLCNDSFTSVSDFVVKCSQNCHLEPSEWFADMPESIALPCISTRCLDQCARSDCTGMGGGAIQGITDGKAQFGANSDIYYSSFYRDGSDLDLFLCLTTVCLEGY